MGKIQSKVLATILILMAISIASTISETIWQDQPEGEGRGPTVFCEISFLSATFFSKTENNNGQNEK